jgi:membrane protein DedA with SNARE-associated domain
MSHVTAFLVTYGYWALFLMVIARQICLPVPANLALVAAGIMARSGALNPYAVIAISVAAFLLADFAWFELGRTLGLQVLHLICRLSRDASICEDQMTAKLDVIGWKTLVVAKFVIGLDSIAAPMAGLKGFTRWRFLLFDSIGAALWSVAYFAAGLLLSKQASSLAATFPKMAPFAIVAFTIVIAFLVARRLGHWHRSSMRKTLLVSPPAVGTPAGRGFTDPAH